MTPEQLRSLSARFAAAKPLDMALWREAIAVFWDTPGGITIYSRNDTLIEHAYGADDPNILFPVALSWLPEGAEWSKEDGLFHVTWNSHHCSAWNEHGCDAAALASAICAARAELLEKPNA